MGYTPKIYTPSQETLSYKRKQDIASNNYNTYANQDYKIGMGGFGKQVKSAQSKLKNLYKNNNLSQTFKYDNQSGYNNALNAVSNRKAFSYDLGEDQLYQQAKEQYQAMGKTAMADTIGQASAMTGGYGNSYATTAGNQAYNSYLQELNNSIGDYYAMALSGYNSETDRLNNVLNAYANDRNVKANEWRGNWDVYNNLYSMYSNERDNMLSNDISVWGQKGSNLYNAANLATNQYSTASGNDINIWNANESNRATAANMEETAKYNSAKLASSGNSDKKKKNDNPKKAKPTITKDAVKLVTAIKGEMYDLMNRPSSRFSKYEYEKRPEKIVEYYLNENELGRELNLDIGEQAYVYDYFGLL